MKFNKNGIIMGRGVNEPPIYDMQTMTLSTGSVWARIFHHKLTDHCLLFSPSFVKDIQEENRYSRLGLLENYRNNIGGFDFICIQPEYPTAVHRWTQTSNPLTTTTVTGYKYISGADGSGLVQGFSEYALLAHTTRSNDWWCAFGTYVTHSAGIPGFGGKVVHESDLYVRIDNVNFKNFDQSFKLTNDKVTTSEIIEM